MQSHGGASGIRRCDPHMAMMFSILRREGYCAAERSGGFRHGSPRPRVLTHPHGSPQADMWTRQERQAWFCPHSPWPFACFWLP